VKKVLRVGKGRKVQVVRPQGAPATADVESMVEVIQALIPLGLAAVEAALAEEVRHLAGERYAGGAPAGTGALGPAAGLGLLAGAESAGAGSAGAGPRAGP